jgi:hypothetical protein
MMKTVAQINLLPAVCVTPEILNRQREIPAQPRLDRICSRGRSSTALIIFEATSRHSGTKRGAIMTTRKPKPKPAYSPDRPTEQLRLVPVTIEHKPSTPAAQPWFDTELPPARSLLKAGLHSIRERECRGLDRLLSWRAF